jgi:cell division septal protein FtsQ
MLPVDEVARRLEGHPWILDASVERDLPTTAVISIIERRPGGWLRDPGGIVVVAGDTTVLERLQARPTHLPEIGELAETPAPGDRAEVPRETLRVAASMSAPLLRQIESLELQDEDVVAQLREGGTALFGPAEELRAKNRALAEMLRWTTREGIEVETIDLRVPTAPALDPVGPRTELPPSPSP